MANPLKNAKNVLVLITGASRGIGYELALQFGQIFAGTRFQFFLLARSRSGLEEVAEKICKIKNASSGNVEIVVADLSTPECSSAFENIQQKIKELETKNKFDLCLIIHNAGTVGDLTKKSSELNEIEQWQNYLQTNLLSTILLNNLIYSVICKEEKKIFIINVTSLLSVKPYPSFTQYSVGKAAREAYFRAFAIEHPNCRVLSYSPGPVDTTMHSEVAEKTYDAGVREVFGKKRHDSNLHRKLLTPTETVQRLIHLLEKNNFENGSRVDYFDK
uniref:Uncharacterized protein n=1 Tax=Meloidogyne enterolobii TaxID=390850 RepID=A0A6V7UZ21_MELEN|nr:unnamed protein product [Meloidogyne enterolobii]